VTAASSTHGGGAAYRHGLQEVADGVFAYLQPDGTWGWSNAGLVAGGDQSLLVDTLFDLRLTRRMLDEMAPVLDGRPIANLVNTHANGDHCYGNQLVAGDGVDILASTRAAAEMENVTPATLHAMVTTDLGPQLSSYVRRIFGPFEFDGIEVAPPTRTFDGALELEVGDRPVHLLEVGPAHTAGDVIAWAPGPDVVFAGDILFIGGTPIVWAGPLSNWVAALDRILALEPAVIVPGHGPLAERADVEALADYFRFVDREAGERADGGMDVVEATREVDRLVDDSPYAGWTDRERICINVDAVYRHRDPPRPATNVLELFGRMAEYPA
jgi:glyoxylase-like metal-dependent hydrolase (beta-lactamase superfamily II)